MNPLQLIFYLENFKIENIFHLNISLRWVEEENTYDNYINYIYRSGRGKKKVQRELLDYYKGDLNEITSSGLNLLNQAVIWRDEEFVNILIDEYKCDIDMKDKYGTNPLLNAAEKGDLNIM